MKAAPSRGAAQAEPPTPAQRWCLTLAVALEALWLAGLLWMAMRPAAAW